MTNITTEKIQKVLAHQGLASRREIERWLKAGRITVNNATAKLGDRITHKDRIQVDGRVINTSYEQQTRTIMYHKPLGEICTRDDPEGRKTVFDQLPVLKKGRWISVGRLDINSSGLLVFTNNGELANQLMHPSSEIEREYAVRVIGDVTEEKIKQLKEGVKLEEGMACFKRITFKGGRNKNTWYHVILTEGRNRQVRRLFESQNITVSRLIRVRFGQYTLPRDSKPGEIIEAS